MTANETPGRSWPQAIRIGLLVAIVTAAAMLALTAAGVSPFPKPPSLAFAEALFGRAVPLPVGLLFHAAYVIFWSALYLRFWRRRSLGAALALAAGLWVVILGVFFPIVGWGLAGTSVSPKLIPASFVPHLLFGLLLWGGDRCLPASSPRTPNQA